MSEKTKIQWCDSTCNPTMGCDGCELWTPGRKTCYAGALHVRFAGKTRGYAPEFEQVTLFPGRMAAAAAWPDLTGQCRPGKPWLDGSPRLIFVSDMSDALSAMVPFEYLDAEIVSTALSEAGRRHQWLWLTKRPERMAEFSRWLQTRETDWPDNLWAGTSITSQATAARVRSLAQVGNGRTTRFLSVEPQVEPLELDGYLASVRWVIQGGESGPRARPFPIEWALDLIRRCREHGVPYFLKQLGSRVLRDSRSLRLKDGHASNWDEWPEEVRVRQTPAAGPNAGARVASV